MNIKGWCPTLFAPMQSGDGWLIRVQPRRATLSAADARLIADAAAEHGNGIIELTNRGNLQIRGLSRESAAAFATALAEAGLAGARTGPSLLISPLAGEDPAVHPQTTAIADALDAVGFGKLPEKFFFAVDGGGAVGLDAVRADIALRARDGRWTIWIDGEPLGAPCDPAAIPNAVLRLCQSFAAHAAMMPAGGARRMRDLVQSLGSGCLFQAAGLVADCLPIPVVAKDPIGFLPYRNGEGSFGLGTEFGHMNANSLTRLAALSERFGDAKLRITPWRSVLIAGVAAAHATALRQAATEFITDPEDPRRRITACSGKPRCISATVDTQATAALLARTIAAGGAIHVSGCAKGCAHPGPAPITLVGNHETYSLVRNGKAGDPPDQAGLTMEQAVRLLAGAA